MTGCKVLVVLSTVGNGGGPVSCIRHLLSSSDLSRGKLCNKLNNVLVSVRSNEMNGVNP